MSKAECALQALQMQKNAGHLQAVISHGKSLLDDKTFDADLDTYAKCCCILASALGHAESAQAEHDLLLRAEAHLQTSEDLNIPECLVEIRWKLAFHFWNMLHYDDALHWIEQALDSAVESTNLEWLVAATSLKARILLELGLYEEVEPQNALILTSAAIWGQPGWAADYLVGNQRLELPLIVGTFLDSGIVSSLESVRQALAETKTFSFNKLSELRKIVVDAWDTEDVVILGEYWGKLNLNAADTRPLDGAEVERLRDLLQRLAPLRAHRLRLDLADKALARVTPGSGLSTELHQLCISLTQLQLDHIRRPSYRRRLVLNYRQVLSRAISEGVGWDPLTLFSHTHYAKHLVLGENILSDEHSESPSPAAGRQITSITHFSAKEAIQVGGLLAEETVPSLFEQASLDINALRQRLCLENAAFLDFFIDPTEGVSHLITVFGDEIRMFPLPLSRKQLTQTLISIQKIVAKTVRTKITSITDFRYDFEILALID